MRTSGRDWSAEGTAGRWTWNRRRPAVGDLLAWEHAAWRVMHIAATEPDQHDRDRMMGYRPGHQAKYAPYKLSLRRVHGPRHRWENDAQDVALRVPSGAPPWQFYEDDQVPLCSCCGHPWPCRMREARQESEQAAKLMDERMARAAPGLCYGCGEVITQRQGSIAFPEANLQLPGAPPPRFHTRQNCRGAILSYEELRAKSLPDAEPVYFNRTDSGVWTLGGSG